MSSEQRSFAADTPVVNFNDKLELPMKKDQVNIHPTKNRHASMHVHAQDERSIRPRTSKDSM